MSYKPNVKLTEDFPFFYIFREEVSSSDEVFEECHSPITNGITSGEFKKILEADDTPPAMVFSASRLPGS